MEHSRRNIQEIKYDTFICYSRQDSEIATVIDDMLSEAGLSTFFFCNAILDSSFQDTVVDVINSSELIIFLCTHHSIQSNWVKSEVIYAYSIGKHIVPITVDNVNLPDDLCLMFAGLALKFNVHSDTLRADIETIVTRIKSSFESKRTVENTKNERFSPEISEGKTYEIDQSHNEGATAPSEIKNSIRKVLSIILYVVIVFVLIYYIFGTFYVFDSGDSRQGISLLTPIVFAVIISVWLAARFRTYDLKLYCEAEDDVESILTITLDDKVVSSIKGKGMVRLRERKSNYLISIDSNNPDIVGENFTYKFCRQNNGDVKQVTLKKKSSSESARPELLPSDITIIRCFIAGSTRLVNERNATRAVLSILYNKWESHNLVISSYTFEDFSNSYTIGGQQIHYNDFIKNKAACAIFIVTENVGDKTLEEYRLAVNTFKDSQSRPKIFVYANNLSNSDSVTKQFIDEVRKNNSYWREYDNITHLMSLVKDDVDSELFNIFVFNK